MTIAGNKGEWSEIYAFLRLLADGKLHAADEHLNRMSNMHFPIIKIMREDSRSKCEYRPIVERGEVEIYLNGRGVLKLPSSDFDAEASRLLGGMTNGKGSSFEFPETETFIRNIHINKLKAPAQDKSDIYMEIHDIHTGFDDTVGFSIKSRIGGLSTLLNAGNTTNFIYRVEGLDRDLIDEINSIKTLRKFKDRMKAITSNGGKLIFHSMENETFRENLRMIDGQMPEMVATMLVGHYTDASTNCTDLSEYLSHIDPLERSKKNYEHNIKEMLCDIALGMKPATEWNGIDEATGGYIVVKSDGDVLAYHIYNRDRFKNYLFANTKFDSGSEKRYGHCALYEEEGELLIKLNLQIRFI